MYCEKVAKVVLITGDPLITHDASHDSFWYEFRLSNLLITEVMMVFDCLSVCLFICRPCESVHVSLDAIHDCCVLLCS